MFTLMQTDSLRSRHPLKKLIFFSLVKTILVLKIWLMYPRFFTIHTFPGI